MDFSSIELQNLLIEDIPAGNIAGEYLLEKCLTKLIPTKKIDIDAAEDTAITLFLEMNDRCASFVLQEDDPEIKRCLSFLSDKLFKMFHSGPDQSNLLTLRNMCDNGMIGPGASVGSREVDLFHKLFSGSLTASSSNLYEVYRNTIEGRWKRAEFNRCSFFGDSLVEGSNLTTVPKTSTVARTICTEPGLNMFFQLGAGTIIEGLLKRFYGIDLAIQPDINRWLAHKGSLDGEYATIDLKSASDTVSLKLLEKILPKRVFENLCFIRSPKTRIRGEYRELNMMSTMGNGFTFPLQTLIFATISAFVNAELRIKTKSQVFGDDIICKKDAYVMHCRILAKLGFIVNTTKSFNVGSFRESCGHDYYLGQNIRPVFIKEINDDAQVFSAFNRLMLWSIRHNVPLPRSLNYIFRLANRKLFVPLDASVDSGFRVPALYSGSNSGKLNDGNYKFIKVIAPKYVVNESEASQYWEGLIITSLRTAIGVTPRSLTDKNCKDGRYDSKGTRIELPKRLRERKLKVMRGYTPSWDIVTDPGLTSRDYERMWFISISQDAVDLKRT